VQDRLKQLGIDENRDGQDQADPEGALEHGRTMAGMSSMARMSSVVIVVVTTCQGSGMCLVLFMFLHG
jgi:hypothetical protein